MTDDFMKVMIDFVDELSQLRTQRDILLRMLDADDFSHIDKATIRKIYGEEVKNDL